MNRSVISLFLFSTATLFAIRSLLFFNSEVLMGIMDNRAQTCTEMTAGFMPALFLFTSYRAIFCARPTAWAWWWCGSMLASVAWLVLFGVAFHHPFTTPVVWMLSVCYATSVTCIVAFVGRAQAAHVTPADHLKRCPRLRCGCGPT